MSDEAQLRRIGRLCCASTDVGPCRAYANSSGMCPSHDKKTPRGLVPFSKNSSGKGHRKRGVFSRNP